MTQTTIAIPQDLLEEIDRIAQSQLRSRNSLIHWMLREQTKDGWQSAEAHTQAGGQSRAKRAKQT